MKTTWTITHADNREQRAEVTVPVSTSTAQAQARLAAATKRNRKLYAGMRRVEADR